MTCKVFIAAIVPQGPSIITMSICTPINVSTLNVNGLGHEIKRLAIFNKLKYDSGIRLLQETLSTTTMEKNGKANGDFLLTEHF